MKIIMKKLFVIALGALCLLCTSCTKEDIVYTDYLWEGTFLSEVINGTTGKSETQTKYINLYFEDEGNKCVVYFGGQAFYLGGIAFYEVRWRGKNSFDLYPTTGEQITRQYTGTVSGKEMTLHALQGEAVTATYKLTRTNYEKD